MIEIIIGGLILAAATAVFKAFWDAVVKWVYSWTLSAIESFVTLVKTASDVVSYLYRRKRDGWYKQEVPNQKVDKKDCPKSVRDALFTYDEVVVKRYQ